MDAESSNICDMRATRKAEKMPAQIVFMCEDDNRVEQRLRRRPITYLDVNKLVFDYLNESRKKN